MMTAMKPNEAGAIDTSLQVGGHSIASPTCGACAGTRAPVICVTTLGLHGPQRKLAQGSDRRNLPYRRDA
jgi:hypothetical protein